MTAVKNAIEATVTKVELRSRPGRDSGWYGREVNDITLMVAFCTSEGQEGWFFTPAARQSISTSGPYTIATLEENDWITTKTWECEGFAGAMGFGDTPISRLKVGDVITFKGRMKRQTRFGPQYWYIKRLDYNHAESEAARRKAAEERLAAARKASGLLRASYTFRTQEEVTRLVEAGQRQEYSPYTPPEIPGVAWGRIGWCGCIYTYEVRMENPAQFCEWAEAGGKVELPFTHIEEK